jgi:hypothetical protein
MPGMSEIVSVHDVFVSYAHIDNAPPSGVDEGWVSNLHYDLERALARQLGGHCSIWFDQSELRGNHSATPEISAKVRKARTLVAVLSKAYLRSKWCLHELSLFRERELAPDGRLFVVDIAGLDRSELQAAGVGDLTAYQFWFRDRTKRIRTYGLPRPTPDEREYYRLLDDLATDIADTLKRDQATEVSSGSSSGTNGEGPGPRPTGKCILMAEVTDDLEAMRQQVRRCLEQAGHSVRLAQTFGKPVEDFKREFERDLEGASLFVQLLSQVSSRSFDTLPEGYAVWQYHAARSRSVRIAQWRDPSITPEAVEDLAQRELLLQNTVLRGTLDSFKRHLLDLTTPVVEPARQAVPSGSLFVNAERSDLHIANRIKDYVGKSAAVFLPVESGRPEELRCNIEANIVDCDGLLVVYGDGGAAWVQQQLRLYNKLAPRRERPIKLLAVIEAPPESKPSINAQIPGMRILNCRAGIDDSVLGTIVSQLGGGSVQ